MSWHDDKARIAEYIIGGLIAAIVALLCYEHSVMADEIKTGEEDQATLKARVDTRDGKDQVRDELLKEVRDDVKELLKRVK